MRARKVKDFDEVNAVLINALQNHLLLEKKLLPQSINRHISGIKTIWNHLFMTGIVAHNTLKDISPLRSMNANIHGCHSLDRLEGIFAHPWADKKSYLLCALIYSAGLRNSEIKNLRLKDIVTRNFKRGGSIEFVSVEKSKRSP